MDSKPHITKPSLTTTAISFELETRTLLQKRLWLLFSVCLIASITAYLNDFFIDDRGAAILNGFFGPWYEAVVISHPISFALGIGLVFILRKSTQQLQITAYVVMTYNILALLFAHAAYQPHVNPLFALALLLFVHAAFIPSRVRYQIGLAITAVAAYPLVSLLSLKVCPAIQAYWEIEGGLRTFQSRSLAMTVNISMLGLITVLVNKTLYNMRRSLHKAKRMGNYLLGEKIGEGGMGQVYVGEHALMCRPTAIKVLQPNEEDREMALARFEREVKLASMLTHPNTITIYDYGRTNDNTFYYAMEFLEGLNLQTLVEKFGPVSVPRCIYFLNQICASLAEAHEHDIIHRDIKPSNIFITRRGGLFDFVKVLDFGLAKQVNLDDTPPGITRKGAFLGTPRYVAPEIIYGNGDIDQRADIYNVGAVAYWMLTGQALFASSSNIELIVDHVKTVPRRPSEISEISIPTELDDIIMKCLQKNPADRYQSVTELMCALTSVPVQDAWTQKQAHTWWSLHFIVQEKLHICPETGRVVPPVIQVS